MKKGILIIVLIFGLLTLSACKKPVASTFNFYEYMDTFINVSLYAESESDAENMKQEIEEIYAMYHELTNNYEDLSFGSTYKENIFTINQKINEDIEIDKELYEILEEAIRLNILTDGYFDISIGKMVDVWKDVISNDVDGYMHNEVPESVFQGILDDLVDIEVVEEPFILTETDGKYYVRLTHEDVKLDLGALSKGYATQVVYDYLMEQGVEYFSITAGSSSISIGKKIDRKTEMFHISLANPVESGQTYGMIYVKNKAINTSGNFEQYFLYEGLRYHHVISPKTKMPAQFYHTVTLVGEDAGTLDALSTALFSMNEEAFEAFITNHQEELNLEVIRFNYDETVSTYLIDTVFEEF